MKLIATIVAIATASTAISYDTKIGCTCCLGSISCCAACCISHCTADAEIQAKVTESLKTIQVILKFLRTTIMLVEDYNRYGLVRVNLNDKIPIKADLNQMETEACGKCALCYMNGDYCSECTRGDGGCPVDAYVQMEVALSALKEE